MSVGQSLAAARADNGMTVEALSSATRIRATLIRAIENNDFSMCGGDVYARGHIRSIASVLGVDPEPFIAEYDVEHPRESIDHTVESIGEEWTPVTRERTRPAWGMAMLAGVLALVSVVALVGILSPEDEPSPVAGAPTTTVTTPAPQVTPSVSVEPTAPPAVEPVDPTPSGEPSTPDTIAQAPQDGVNLRLRVTGKQCWVSVTDSAGKQTQATLRAGDVRDFTDDEELRIIIGDAGALEVIHNGEDLGTLGASGAVVKRTFGVTDPTAGVG